MSIVKRLIRRVIAWELTPISDQVNRLQRATADALDQADEATRAPDAGEPASGAGSNAGEPASGAGSIAEDR